MLTDAGDFARHALKLAERLMAQQARSRRAHLLGRITLTQYRARLEKHRAEFLKTVVK